MHIVATGRLSGAEKVVSDICTNLNRDDFATVAVCAGDELKKYYEKKGIKAYIIDVNHLAPSQIKGLKEIIRKEKIDIVHGHDVKASIAGYLAASKENVPAVSHIHASYPWLDSFGILKIIDGYFRKKYNLTIACSNMAREYYLQYNKSVNKDKVVALNNSFNFNEFQDIKIMDKHELRRKLNIGDNAYIYGFLGRLLEGKGADLMIDSFNEIQKHRDDVTLLIVGDGPERDKLENKVANYGISDKVKFAGFQKNPYDYMNLFDCFILPSVSEGLPIAVLESMAMKKAVISTPVAGLKDLLKDNYNGIVLKERSKEALVEAMTRLYSNPALAAELSANAYDYLKKNYDINTYIQRLKKIYMDIIDMSKLKSNQEE